MAWGRLATNASAASVQSTLEGLASIGSVAVVKTTDTKASQIWKVTFQGTLAGTTESDYDQHVGLAELAAQSTQ